MLWYVLCFLALSLDVLLILLEVHALGSDFCKRILVFINSTQNGKCSQKRCLQICDRLMKCGHRCQGSGERRACGECYANGGCKGDECRQPCLLR